MASFSTSSASQSPSHKPSNPYAPPPTEDPTIYILGTGSVGKFLAHSIQSAPNPPPITLLFHRPTYLRDLRNRKCHLRVTSQLASPHTTETRGPFDAELILPYRRPDTGTASQLPLISTEDAREKYARFLGDDNQLIYHLVVCVKAHQTISALEAVKHRLGRHSTLLFLQNGMGTVEQVQEYLWPDPEKRPRFMVGINSHGVHATGPYSVVHAGAGVIYLGILPKEKLPEEPSSEPLKPPPGVTIQKYPPPRSFERKPAPADANPRYLLNALTRVPLLTSVPLPPSELYIAQLEKLAVNTVLNPLTVILDSRNGDILHNNALSRTMRLLLHEFAHVFLSQPQLRTLVNARQKLDPKRLEAILVGVARKTAQNISSMLQDVRRGTQTEVEYLNGYVVRKGEEVGIRPVMHYMIMQLIKGKQQLVSREVDDYAPFGGLEDLRLRRDVKKVNDKRNDKPSPEIAFEREPATKISPSSSESTTRGDNDLKGG